MAHIIDYISLTDVFLGTRELSNEKYSEYTEKMKNNTHVYTEKELDNLKGDLTDVNVSAVISDTASYILNTEIKGRRAALNFADGYKRGGEVLGGATTQEEDLCRKSNLYEALMLPECTEKYYDYNKKDIRFNRGLSSDRIIYSKDVLFFRDSYLDEISEITDNNFCDVITCPAPMLFSAKANKDYNNIVLHRMEGIIKVAADNNIHTLILGAWGCGAFGNDLEEFLELWNKIIKNNRYVPEIVFPFMDEVPSFFKEKHYNKNKLLDIFTK